MPNRACFLRDRCQILRGFVGRITFWAYFCAGGRARRLVHASRGIEAVDEECGKILFLHSLFEEFPQFKGRFLGKLFWFPQDHEQAVHKHGQVIHWLSTGSAWLSEKAGITWLSTPFRYVDCPVFADAGALFTGPFRALWISLWITCGLLGKSGFRRPDWMPAQKLSVPSVRMGHWQIQAAGTPFGACVPAA